MKKLTTLSMLKSLLVPTIAFSLLVLTGNGCTSSSGGKNVYEKDGELYGVTEGRFRGRWWNYYERGRSFQQGGFFAEAEQDFRVALQSRRKDSLWPRTYGMHFIPEYFPHRELGINLYLQADFEGSAQELQTSLEQQYSARAAYYFELVQRELFELGAIDSGSPTVEVLTAQNNLSATEIVLAGIAHDDTFVTGIEIDGVPFDIRVIEPDVAFEVPYVLGSGKNTAQIRVTDISGKEHLSEVVFTNDLSGPAVSFDEPVNLPGVVRGRAYDPSGVTALRVGDTAARIEELDDGLVAFEVAVATATSPIRFSCTDGLGNATIGGVPGLESENDLPAVALASNSPEFAAVWFNAAIKDKVAASVVRREPIKIEMENILDGAAFYQDDIFATIKARSDEPIEEIVLLDDVISVAPASKNVQFTHRLRLAPGDNELNASVMDNLGNSADVRKNVTRDENELEVVENRLAVAIVPEGGTGDEFASKLIARLRQILVVTRYSAERQETTTLMERFDVLNRDEDKLQKILRELALSTELSAEEKQLHPENFVPFEMLITLNASLENETFEFVVDFANAERSALSIPRVEVAGAEKDEDFLLEALAARILQEFPSAQGEVTSWENYPKLVTTLTKLQGARKNHKCLIFSLDSTGEPHIEAEGFVTGAGSAGSPVEVIKSLRDGVEVGGLELGEGYHVVLK